MNFSRIFILRPVATTIVMSALVIFGWFAYRLLPVSDLPNVDFPTIVISASLPGADPETMASTVATPIEKQLSTIAGIDSLSSSSTQGQTQITIQFVLERNIDAAAEDVQAAISQAMKLLPPQMPAPPSLRKVNPTQAPVLYLAMTADNLPLSKLDEYAEDYMAARISMLAGVAEVDVYGSQQYAVRLRFNPYALANRGITLEAIAAKIPLLNTKQPSGTLQASDYYKLIKVDGQLNNAKEFNEAVLTNINDSIVKVKDVGYALDSVVNDKIATWCNKERAIVLAVQRQPGSNTIEVVNKVLKALPQVIQALPGGIHAKVIYDRSVFIKESIKEVQFTLLLAIFLVIGIVYLFLNNFASSLITILDFPTSLIATFSVMYLLSYSLDNLSLMGLVLAVGFVIDDTIVVLENILRHLETGVDRITAALNATQEISFTVISMTLSLAAVFIPILFMGGLLGRLFHEFAVVVGAAILFSGFVALTLSPMLRSRFLITSSQQNSNIVLEKFTLIFEKSRQFYIRSLGTALNHSNLILGGSGVIFVAMIMLFYWIPKGFIPSEDMGTFTVTTQVNEGVTFPNFVTKQQEAAAMILQHPAVNALVSSVGQGAAGVVGTTTGRMFVQLKPLAQRQQSVDEIIQQLRQQLTKITGIKIFLQNTPSINIGSISTSGKYQYVIQGRDWQQLQTVSQAMAKEMKQIKGLIDLNSDLQLNNPELRLHILRDYAATLGITPNQIEQELYLAYGQAQVSTIITPIDQYQVIMEVDPDYQKNISFLERLHLQAANGTMIPLSSVVTIEQGVGPLAANHFMQIPAVTLSFDLVPGTSLGEVTEQIEVVAQQALPGGVSARFVGYAQYFQDSMSSLPALLLFTVLVIYMVLAILYEHFIHPLTILTALPFAAFGALVSLLVCGQELNIFSFIGIIMLVGLVKKNGIIMVDFAIEAERVRKLSPREAILQACEVRYRPIMMTTFAAIFATLPMALGLGAGSESRRAMGIAVVGGLFFSQTLTLYVTPIFYLTVEKIVDKFR